MNFSLRQAMRDLPPHDTLCITTYRACHRHEQAVLGYTTMHILVGKFAGQGMLPLIVLVEIIEFAEDSQVRVTR